MSLIIYFSVPFIVISYYSQFGLMMSNCLRAVCIYIVYKYWALLRQLPGFMKFGAFGSLFRGRNQRPAQQTVVPSTEVQQA